MRNLKINAKHFFVLNYLGQVEVLDENHNKTGETVNSYSDPIPVSASVSSAKGNSQAEMFGTQINYDKTIVMSKNLCAQLGITENSVLFLDQLPQFDENNFPLYDYKVVKIAKTINEVAVAVSKVRAN